MANMVKYNVMKKNVAVLEDTVEKLEQERAAAMSQAVDEEQQHKVQKALDWFAAKMSKRPSTPVPLHLPSVTW